LGSNLLKDQGIAALTWSRQLLCTAESAMSSRTSNQSADLLHAELTGAILAALASGQHCDHDLLVLHEHLLVLHERYREMGHVSGDVERVSADACLSCGSQEIPQRTGITEDTYRQSLLRSLASTPARTPLGIAAKLAIACHLNGHFEAAQEDPDGLHDSHIIVSAFFDSMMQARLLPAGQQAPRH
jgi:hypothetical protein